MDLYFSLLILLLLFTTCGHSLSVLVEATCQMNTNKIMFENSSLDHSYNKRYTEYEIPCSAQGAVF